MSEEAKEFLDTLWADMPKGPAIQIWTSRNKTTHYFASTELAANYAVLEAANGDLYMGAGLAKSVRRSDRTRARNHTVVGIPGLWADIDVIGGPQGKTDAAPSKSAALELAHELLEPTIIVGSGYGLQAWWLFGEPWMFTTEPERDQAGALLSAFHSALRAKANHSIDRVGDLARMMRVPGTLNHKDAANPMPVVILANGEKRYELDTLHGVGKAYMAEASKAAGRQVRGEVEVDGVGDPPIERLMELGEIDLDFDAVWKRKLKMPYRGKVWSQSDYEASISMRLVHAGFSDQEIVNSISYHRRRSGEKVEKAERMDYLTRTVASARAKVEVEDAEEEFQQRRDESITKLERVSANGGAPASVTISLFNEVMGGPEIKEVIQDGTDPETARFRVILADGREIPLGAVNSFVDQRRFANAFLVVTQYHMPTVKAAKWHKVIQALSRAASIREEVEDARARRAIAWLEPYLENRMSTDRDQAMRVADPFEDDGMVHVSLEPFLSWVRKMRGERIAKPDLQLLMEAAGFDRKTLNYVRSDGSKSTRSYYLADRDSVGL